MNVSSRLRKLFSRVAVEQRAGADQDQALVLVGDVDVAVQRMDRLLVVLGMLRARRIGRDRRRRGDGRGAAAVLHVELLAERRDGRRGDALGEPLVVDERDVEHPQPAVAAGRVEVLAAGLQAQDVRLRERA